MRAFFVIVPAPILYLFPGVCKAQEPMRIQAFNPKPPVESFDESIVGGLARSAEVERDTPLVSPEIQIPGYKLGSLIDADRCRQSDPSGDLLQDVGDIDTPECKPRLQCRRETQERINDCQHAQFLAGRKLVVHE